MENYFARLLLTSELDDPIYFAKIHQQIADLEKQRIAHFNVHGPMNAEYVVLMGEVEYGVSASPVTPPASWRSPNRFIRPTKTSMVMGRKNRGGLDRLGTLYLDDGRARWHRALPPPCSP